MVKLLLSDSYYNNPQSSWIDFHEKRIESFKNTLINNTGLSYDLKNIITEKYNNIFLDIENKKAIFKLTPVFNCKKKLYYVFDNTNIIKLDKTIIDALSENLIINFKLSDNGVLNLRVNLSSSIEEKYQILFNNEHNVIVNNLLKMFDGIYTKYFDLFYDLYQNSLVWYDITLNEIKQERREIIENYLFDNNYFYVPNSSNNIDLESYVDSIIDHMFQYAPHNDLLKKLTCYIKEIDKDIILTYFEG